MKIKVGLIIILLFLTGCSNVKEPNIIYRKDIKINFFQIKDKANDNAKIKGFITDNKDKYVSTFEKVENNIIDKDIKKFNNTKKSIKEGKKYIFSCIPVSSWCYGPDNNFQLTKVMYKDLSIYNDGAYIESLVGYWTYDMYIICFDTNYLVPEDNKCEEINLYIFLEMNGDIKLSDDIYTLRFMYRDRKTECTTLFSRQFITNEED